MFTPKVALVLRSLVSCGWHVNGMFMERNLIFPAFPTPETTSRDAFIIMQLSCLLITSERRKINWTKRRIFFLCLTIRMDTTTSTFFFCFSIKIIKTQRDKSCLLVFDVDLHVPFRSSRANVLSGHHQATFHYNFEFASCHWQSNCIIRLLFIFFPSRQTQLTLERQWMISQSAAFSSWTKRERIDNEIKISNCET